MLAIWQSTITDVRGNVVPGAVLQVRRESDQALVTVYRDEAGLDPYPTGIVTADGNGYAYFYAEAQKYRLRSFAPAIDWRNVDVGGAGQVVARLSNPDSADDAAGMTAFGKDVEYLPGTVGWKLGRSATRVVHKAFAGPAATNTLVVADGAVDDLHRNFGGIVEGIDGTLWLNYRRAPEHALTDGATLYCRKSNNGGASFGPEAIQVSPTPGFDQRGSSMFSTPSGRVGMIFDRCPVPAAGPTTFHLALCDDNDNWNYVGQIASTPYAYARAFGRIKVIPGNEEAPYGLVWTPYYQSSATPTYRVAVWISWDDGVTWAESTPIDDSTTGYNECELVAINELLWFAFCRSNSGITQFVTTDGGQTWTNQGVVSLTSTGNQVAPTVDKFMYEGRWKLLLSYCNRQSGLDTLVFRVADAEEALASPSAFGGAINGATDMTNASGYQCPITRADGVLYVDGGIGYVEFKEYVGETYSQVRFVKKDLIGDAAPIGRTVQVQAGEISVAANGFEKIIWIGTGGAATADITRISGGYPGQVLEFRSTSSSGDPILRSGIDNIQLACGDMRLNTTLSRIVLRRCADIWVEVARTQDSPSIGAALVISSGAITVPNSLTALTFLVGTEGMAATDDLVTINGGLLGQEIILTPSSSSYTITAKASGGNLQLASDLVMSGASFSAVKFCKLAPGWRRVG